MAKCDQCGKEITFPFTCGYCGKSFCSEHRLPENHSCEGLEEVSKKSQEEGRIYRGVSKDLKREPERAEKEVESPGFSFKIGGEPPEESRERKSGGGFSNLFGGPFSLLKGFFFQRVTMVFILIMFLVYIGQFIAKGFLGQSQYYNVGDYGTFLYYLAPSLETVVSRPWTLVTSIFVHGDFFHFFINALILFFIGTALERRIGQKKFISVFLGAGFLASLAQILVTEPSIVVLGASGAILGVLGALTVLAPRMPILLFFFIPMPLWMLTLGYGTYSALSVFIGGEGSIGHMAHFAGLIVGLIYGYKLRRERRYRHPILDMIYQ